MASIEALEKLRDGGLIWSDYVQNSVETVDLTFADLSDADLRGRHFFKCDLSGAVLVGANLDGAFFEKVTLNGANFANTSMVDCYLNGATAIQLDLSNSIIRNSKFLDFNFRKANVQDVLIEDCTFQKCFIFDCKIDNTKCENVEMEGSSILRIKGSNLLLCNTKFKKCTLQEWEITSPEIKGCAFNFSQLDNLNLQGGSFVNSDLSQAKIIRLTIENAVVENLDMSGSVVKHVAIVDIGPATATFLKTSFISCVWPDQSGKVTLTGKYLPSPHLLRQPIQDVYGVEPVLRREAGDAQYLVERLANSKSLSQRIILRVWGASSAFGQSLKRLTIYSLVVVVAHTLILLMIRKELFGFNPPNFNLFLQELGNMGGIFLGFGDLKLGTPNIWTTIVGVSARIEGVICLGIWITIAAAKYNKLSSY